MNVGWDNGVMGGVVATDGFLSKFFPSIQDKVEAGTEVWSGFTFYVHSRTWFSTLSIHQIKAYNCSA